MKKKTLVKQDNFLHALGHDVKQPLGLIRAYSYYIKKSTQKVAPEISEYTDKIDEQVDVITSMLNNIVETTKIIDKSIVLNSESVDINAVLTQLIQETQKKNPNTTIELDTPKNPVTVTGDKLYLELALRHVLDNAVLYSPKPSTISAVVTAEKMIKISISNQSAALSKEEVAQLTEPYYRASNAKEIKVKKLGLGLFIAKEIIETHTGELTISRPSSTELCVTISLPFLRE